MIPTKILSADEYDVEWRSCVISTSRSSGWVAAGRLLVVMGEGKVGFVACTFSASS